MIRALVWIVAFQAMSYVSGLANKTALKDWYIFIHKSNLTPPRYVFGIVWPMLYLLLALAGYLLWRDKKTTKVTKAIYALQMVLNWSWTTLFFHFKLLMTSWIVIAVMIALTAALIVRTYKNNPRVGLLLLPYLCWICFALYLNIYIWLYN